MRAWPWNIALGLATVLTLALVAVLTLVAVVSLNRQVNITRSQEQQVCIAKTTALAISGIAEAFATPPAPNADRQEAVNKIRAASSALRDITKTCP